MADKPAAAPRVIERIRTAVERLQEFPFLGRPGRVEGTRELVIAGTPYIVPIWLRAMSFRSSRCCTAPNNGRIGFPKRPDVRRRYSMPEFVWGRVCGVRRRPRRVRA